MRISIDDASQEDVRLADLCSKYELDATFYWPVEWHTLAYSKGYNPLTFGNALDISKRFEIGSHTITHPLLTHISLDEATYEIIGSKLMLELMFDKPIRKFCPPRGYSNEDLDMIILSQYQSRRLTKGKGLVHIHPNSGANNHQPWLDCVNEETDELWCHGWEIEKYNLWEELEAYLEGRNS